jgi:hypothetical protein
MIRNKGEMGKASKLEKLGWAGPTLNVPCRMPGRKATAQAALMLMTQPLCATKVSSLTSGWSPTGEIGCFPSPSHIQLIHGLLCVLLLRFLALSLCSWCHCPSMPELLVNMSSLAQPMTLKCRSDPRCHCSV